MKRGDFRRIPSYCPTRWYGNFSLFYRILEHLSTLTAYFETKPYEDQQVAQTLKSLATMLYLQFVRAFLKKTLENILKFQKNDALLAEAQEAMDNMMVEFNAYILRDAGLSIEKRYELPYDKYSLQEHRQLFYSEEEIVQQIALCNETQIKLQLGENGIILANGCTQVEFRELCKTMVNYVSLVLKGLRYYYGSAKARIHSLCILLPMDPVQVGNLRYWLLKYKEITVAPDKKQNLFKEADIWNIKLQDYTKIFKEECG